MGGWRGIPRRAPHFGQPSPCPNTPPLADPGPFPALTRRTTQTRAFDTEAAGSSSATGFVVDKKRGLILTNRHVVTPGPIVGECIFQNHEDVDLRVVYYDPVHDFG